MMLAEKDFFPFNWREWICFQLERELSSNSQVIKGMEWLGFDKGGRNKRD